MSLTVQDYNLYTSVIKYPHMTICGGFTNLSFAVIM